jgi:hypothetical protein
MISNSFHNSKQNRIWCNNNGIICNIAFLTLLTSLNADFYVLKMMIAINFHEKNDNV